MIYFISMESGFFRLKLISPLFYIPEERPDPFNYQEGDGEKLFCFELDDAQAFRFEPEKERLLGDLVFGGKAAGRPLREANGSKLAELPAGDYFFIQKRELLSKDGILNLATEVQQEGLWQRIKFGKKLYLRFFFEDGRPVTQILRSCQNEKRI
jgi:hypothetical protein